ncbi:acid stress response protein YqgB [Klebsiella pneumoniae]|uniref:acid stress response protein YqgB n=1 Tax=Klebsiella pneumoniae TaxID=573 RepID=UPI00397645DD
MFTPSRRFSGFQGRSAVRKLNKGLLPGKSFLVVSPDCHTLFGYVFYDDMNKKPVAQSQNQQIVLGFRTVHGLLSHLWTAIVVNCLTLIIKN